MMKKGKKQTEHLERKKTHDELKNGGNMAKYCEGI